MGNDGNPRRFSSVHRISLQLLLPERLEPIPSNVVLSEAKDLTPATYSVTKVRDRSLGEVFRSAQDDKSVLADPPEDRDRARHHIAQPARGRRQGVLAELDVRADLDSPRLELGGDLLPAGHAGRPAEGTS